MSTVISETAESMLCKQETAMRETISVSFPGKFSGWTAMGLHDDVPSSQASKESRASWSVTVELMSTVPPSPWLQFTKPTVGELHDEKGPLFLPVGSDELSLSGNSGALRKPLPSVSLVFTRDSSGSQTAYWQQWKMISVATNFKKQIFKVELQSYIYMCVYI